MQAVFTGAPGAGKTTALNALENATFSGILETAREFLGSDDGLKMRDADPEGFAKACFEIDLKKLTSAKLSERPMIFDRGLGDALGYFFLTGKSVPERLRDLATGNRYSGPVFDFPPWREIYCQDNLRTQSFVEAEESRNAVVSAWTELGYRPISVPLTDIEARRSWIKKQLV